MVLTALYGAENNRYGREGAERGEGPAESCPAVMRRDERREEVIEMTAAAGM